MQLNKSLFSTVISLPVTSSLTLPSTKHLEKYKTSLTFPDPHLLPSSSQLLLSASFPLYSTDPAFSKEILFAKSSDYFWPLSSLPSPKSFTFWNTSSFFKLYSFGFSLIPLYYRFVMGFFMVFNKYVTLYSLLNFLGFLDFFPLDLLFSHWLSELIHFSITIMYSEFLSCSLWPRPAFLVINPCLQLLTVEILIFRYNSLYSRIVLLSTLYPTNPLLPHVYLSCIFCFYN